MNNPQMDIVMIGVEEGLILEESGHRSIMLSKAFSQSELVRKVVVITCPICLQRRLGERFKRTKRLGDLYPLISRKGGISVVKVTEKLFIISLTSLFPESWGLLSKMGRSFILRKIRHALEGLGLKDMVLWISNPRITDIASKIPSRIKVFDSVDNLLVHPETKKFQAKIKDAYGWIGSHVDLLCIASEGQCAMFPRNPKLFLLPNGVDPLFLSNRRSEIPEGVRSIAKPVVGYVGALQDRLDVDLLERVVNLMPAHNFVFVGPVSDPGHMKPLMKYRNVFILGNKRFYDIPDYIDSFDVCMIPHKINEFTNSMNPLKIVEYLARGKPVVSTAVAGTERFREYLYIANGPEAFCEAIKTSLAENTTAKEHARRAALLGHSWDIRVKTVLDKINDIMCLRGANG